MVSSIAPPPATREYGKQAYRSDDVPDQRRKRSMHQRSAISQMGTFRMPWGGTEDKVPDSIMSVALPKTLRRYEEKGDPLAGTGHQGRFDHECFRYAPLAARFRIINFLEILSRAFFFISLPLSVMGFFLSWYAMDSHLSFIEEVYESWSFYAWVIGSTAVIWIIIKLTLHLFMNWFLKAGKGPLWELNRRTGIVTVWEYPVKFPFIPRRPPEVYQAPFYEFDAVVAARADQTGIVNYVYFYHRYSDLEAQLGDILAASGLPQPCYAFWDFIQNYMDVTQPLPDISALEPFRHLDPVTAEHDRQTKRPPRYWRDMDEATFKARRSEMGSRVLEVTMMGRPNQMAGKALYM